MNRILRQTLSIICLMALITLPIASLTGCVKKNKPAGNVLRLPLKDDVKTLDPVNVYDTVSNEVFPEIVESPLQYKYLEEQYVLEPNLAESMPEYSKDGLTVTLKFRKGVLYQDDPCFKANGGKGRELKAQDFINGFKRHALPGVQSQGAWVFEGKIVGFDDFVKKMKTAKKEDQAKVFEDPIPGFILKDDYTIEFKLTQAYPMLNYILAMGFTAPVPKEAVDMYADSDGNLRDHPIGTGPFILKSWETNQKIVLVRNSNYKEKYPTSSSEFAKAKGLLVDSGKQMPFVDSIEFYILKEDMPRYLQMEKGDLDHIQLTKDSFQSGMVDENHVKAEVAKKGITYGSEDSLVIWYVGFNMNDKLLQNKFLRQAVSSAINREKFIDTFFKYRGLKQTQVTPPGVMDRLPNATLKYDYHVEKGKELLAKAGYPDGKGLPPLTFDFRGADTKYRQMGEFFVEQLGAIGIKVNVILNTFPAYLEKAKQNNLQVFLGGWSYDYPDAENGFQLLYGPNKSPGPNDTNYQNPKYDVIYKKMAVMAAGKPGRADLAKQMEEIVQEDCPWANLSYEKTYYLYNERVKNYRVAEVIPNKYKYLRLDLPAKK